MVGFPIAEQELRNKVTFEWQGKSHAKQGRQLPTSTNTFKNASSGFSPENQIHQDSKHCIHVVFRYASCVTGIRIGATITTTTTRAIYRWEFLLLLFSSSSSSFPYSSSRMFLTREEEGENEGGKYQVLAVSVKRIPPRSRGWSSRRIFSNGPREKSGWQTSGLKIETRRERERKRERDRKKNNQWVRKWRIPKNKVLGSLKGQSPCSRSRECNLHEKTHKLFTS